MQAVLAYLNVHHSLREQPRASLQWVAFGLINIRVDARAAPSADGPRSQTCSIHGHCGATKGWLQAVDRLG